MMKLTSKTNDRIKHLKKLLADRDYRYEQKESAVEGLRALAGIKDALELYVREDVNPPDIECAKVYEVSKGAFESAAATENSQGIIAVAKLNILGASSIDKNSKYILLDRLQDPGNMGTIIRTACAFGFKGIIVTPGSTDPFAPKVTRAAASALWKLDIIKIENAEELAPFNIIAAETGGEDAADFNWPDGFLLAVGSEAGGLSTEIKGRAKKTVGIPIKTAMESLNAAVSAGILMYLASKPRGS
jgi:TrmH family RNA methyltransferase